MKYNGHTQFFKIPIWWIFYILYNKLKTDLSLLWTKCKECLLSFHKIIKERIGKKEKRYELQFSLYMCVLSKIKFETVINFVFFEPFKYISYISEINKARINQENNFLQVKLKISNNLFFFFPFFSLSIFW